MFSSWTLWKREALWDCTAPRCATKLCHESQYREQEFCRQKSVNDPLAVLKEYALSSTFSLMA